MIGWLKRLLGGGFQDGGYIGKSELDPCLGCQRAQFDLNTGSATRYTCHLCRCTWMRTPSTKGPGTSQSA